MPRSLPAWALLIFSRLAHRLFRPFDGPLAQSRRPPPQQCDQPGIWSGFFLGFAFPSLDALHRSDPRHRSRSRRRQRTIGPRVLLLAVYSAGLAIPFLLTALGISQFMVFYKNFRKYLHAVELFSGALLLLSGLVFVNKLTLALG